MVLDKETGGGIFNADNDEIGCVRPRDGCIPLKRNALVVAFGHHILGDSQNRIIDACHVGFLVMSLHGVVAVGGLLEDGTGHLLDLVGADAGGGPVVKFVDFVLVPEGGEEGREEGKECECADMESLTLILVKWRRWWRSSDELCRFRLGI